jgi:hypothetical protein
MRYVVAKTVFFNTKGFDNMNNIPAEDEKLIKPKGIDVYILRVFLLISIQL